MKTISIIIVQYGKPEYTRQCVESMLAFGLPETVIRIYLVDNASPKAEDRGMLASLATRDARIKIVQNQTNLGFGKAHNEVLLQDKADYFLLINNDTKLFDESLTTLIGWSLKRSVVAATGILLNSDFTLQPSTRGFYGYPRPFYRLLWAIGAKLAKSRTVRRVFSCNGALLLISSEVFRSIGGFSPEYFMYGEDFDLMLKLSRKNIPIYQNCRVRLIHFGGVSGGEIWSSGEKTKLQFQLCNRAIRNNCGRSALYISHVIAAAVAFKALALSAIRAQPTGMRAALSKIHAKVTS